MFLPALRLMAPPLLVQVSSSHHLALPESAMFPGNDQSSVYDWCFDQEQRTWVQWMDTVPEFKCDPDRPFSQVFEEVWAPAVPHTA